MRPAPPRSVSSALIQVITVGRDKTKEALIRLLCLFVSPDTELRPDCCSGRRPLTDIKAGTKNGDLREGKRGTGQTPTLKTRASGRTDKTASASFVYHSGLSEMSLYGP